MDISYCLRCKRKTKILIQKDLLQKKYLVKSLCNVYKSKKSKFVSKQHVEGFLSNLFSKIPILNKII